MEYGHRESDMIKQLKNNNFLCFKHTDLLSFLQTCALPISQEVQVQSLGQDNPLEKEMATHCSILA